MSRNEVRRDDVAVEEEAAPIFDDAPPIYDAKANAPPWWGSVGVWVWWPSPWPDAPPAACWFVE